MRARHRNLLQTGAALAVLTASASASGGGSINSTELAGNSLTSSPFFEYVKAFNEGAPIQVAIDPGAFPGVVGQTADLYIVASKTISEWGSSPALVDLSGSVETVNLSGAGIGANTFTVDGGSLSGDAGIELGVGYDVVLDMNQNGVLDGGDYIDGYNNVESGAYVVADTVAPGPLAVTELTYDLTTAAFDSQNTFYPTNIASLGELPLVVMSHGNGHNYQWYDHLGEHLASYGYVLMSHQNNTGPGVEFAATTTLSNADDFLDNLGTIGGGVLQGHIDTDNIIYIGHSRGGEGVVIAYDRIFDGVFVPQNYSLDDIKLVSSIAPVDFQTLPNTDPHGVNYHLWTGGSDSDVNGCANCNLCQTFHLHDRAQEYRQSISLHGVGHGHFHNGGGNPWATGPCLVGAPDTHRIMKGYVFPLVERYIDGNIPAKDFLTRQWESFQPIGAPTANPCVVVDLMYRDGSAPGKIVLDDFQSNPSTTQASIGVPVGFTVSDVTEGDLDDANTTFTSLASDAMNGMTVNGSGADDSAGVVFEWDNTDSYFAWFGPAGGVPITPWKYISFRACQATRDAFTAASLGDLTFDVTLVDTNGTFSRVNIGAFGGGIEEPYQRTGCGGGVGWANEFETVRIPIQAFAYNNSGIDLSKVFVIGLEFGPSHGSAQGRIGLDDVELLID
ncbi:MAG: hypothetical protein AAF682_03505 [Planctomycetota bacterium]